MGKGLSKNTENTSGKIVPSGIDQNTLLSWSEYYLKAEVVGGSAETLRAKTRDLKNFMSYFEKLTGSYHPHHWTPSVSKGWKSYLEKEKYEAATINRMLATVRTFANWTRQRGYHIPASHPFKGVTDLATDEPVWNGLTNRQVTLLKSAVDIRVATCKKVYDNPLLEAAVFYCLLTTGMREFELVSLDLAQYHGKSFHNLRRKGSKVTKKIVLPKEARYWLDRYLYEVRLKAFHKGLNALIDYDQNKPADGLSELMAMASDNPIFAGRRGNRLSEKGVYHIMTRLSGQASSQLAEKEKFTVAPHMLRHTFLKRVADKEGIHVAQKLSGNVSMKEIWRYTQPSEEEIREISENLYD